MMALDEWLGVHLFDRGSKLPRLTETGLWFRQVAQDLLAEVARCRAIAEANSATLRFAVTHALSFTFIPRWPLGLEARTTIGPIQLMSDVYKRCDALLLQNQVQFLLSHAHERTRVPLHSGGYRSLILGSDELIPVSAADKNGQPIRRLSDASKSAPLLLLDYSDESGFGGILRVVYGVALVFLPVQQVFTDHLASDVLGAGDHVAG